VSETNKQERDIAGMFDSIAGRYDFLNHLLSLGIDRRWRRSAIRMAGKLVKPSSVLDVATGTADFAIDALRLNPARVIGLDISVRMLELGREKIRRMKMDDRIELVRGDSLSLPFADDSFDLVMSAFGVRNFSDLFRGISEMTRVTARNGIVLILEFSRPGNRLFRWLFEFYFFRILPGVGRLVSGHKSAYKYLPVSVESFPGRDEFAALLIRAGLSDVKYRDLSGGIAVIYTGVKR